MGKLGSLEILTTRARAAIRLWLDTIGDPDKWLADIGNVMSHLSNLDVEVLPAFEEVILGKFSSSEKILASGAILICATESTRAIDDRYIRAASDFVVDCLRNGDVHDKATLCSVLMFSALPNAAEEPLRELLKSENDLLKVTAAAVLAQWGIARESAIPILTRAMGSDDERLLSIAAIAFAQTGIRADEGADQLIAVFGRVNPCAQLLIVLGLHGEDKANSRTERWLTGVVKNQALHSHVRGRAAFVLASVSSRPAAAAKTLLELLSEPNADLIIGAIEGMEALGSFPSETADRLLPHLEGADTRLRETAAIAISKLGAGAVVTLPALLRRLDRESNLRVCEALGQALAACGTPAVHPLVDRLRRGDTRNVPAVTAALGGMGCEAAPIVARELLLSPDHIVRTAGYALLRGMGRGAASAIPQLAEALPLASDETAANILAVIMATGPAGVAALPAVLDWLNACNDDAAWMAEQILLRLGPPAVEAMNAVLPSATSKGRPRIEALLQRLAIRPPEEFTDLRELRDDNLLELFAAVGMLFDKYEALSWKRAAELLMKDTTNGHIAPLAKGCKASSLRAMVQKLEERFGPITTRQPGKKGQLTNNGRDLLARVRRYLNLPPP